MGLTVCLGACSAKSVGRQSGINPFSGGSGADNPTGAGSSATNPNGGGLLPSAGSSPGLSGVSGSTGLMPGTCAQGMRTTSPITPTVWLIVDGSSSMTSKFDGTRSRWDALRSTLVDPGGVVDTLQATVRFGMVIYAGGNTDPANCVQLVTVPPALNNLAMLTASYPTQPLGNGTPTDKALDYVVTNLPVLNMPTLDAKAGPVYVVLATDGQPNDLCGNNRGGGGQTNPAVEQRVIDVTTKGTQMGMRMFVVSMAGSDMSLQNHLNAVAAATQSKTPPYVPSSQGELVKAFQDIVGSASCQVDLNGTVKTGSECSGMVQLNSVGLMCGSDNGWRLFDPHTVQLTGSACQTFLSQDSMVIAKFTCDVFTPE